MGDIMTGMDGVVETRLGEVGEVIGTEGNRLVVKMVRKEACAKCRACTAGLKSEDMVIKAVNLCDGKVGDKVEVMLDNADFMRAALIMYGIPFIAFMIGVVAGYYGADALGLAYREYIGIGLGFVLVVAAYLGIRSQEKRFSRGNYVPKAVNIVK
jgi:sigma-E factor negative regulatory protein RseC